MCTMNLHVPVYGNHYRGGKNNGVYTCTLSTMPSPLFHAHVHASQIQMLKHTRKSCTDTTLTSIDDEHVTKVLLGRRIVTSKVQNTVTNTHSTVATTTFDPITCYILLLPLSSICMDNEREGRKIARMEEV